ncbi:MAG: hypothetical protein ACYTG6_09580 [Planctomycetota bacterium]|jgi:hypothetical protein
MKKYPTRTVRNGIPEIHLGDGLSEHGTVYPSGDVVSRLSWSRALLVIAAIATLSVFAFGHVGAGESGTTKKPELPMASGCGDDPCSCRPKVPKLKVQPPWTGPLLPWFLASARWPQPSVILIGSSARISQDEDDPTTTVSTPHSASLSRHHTGRIEGYHNMKGRK